VARALCFIIQQQQFWIHSIQCPQLSLAQFQNTNWTISATDHTIQNIRGPCPLQSRSLPSTAQSLRKETHSITGRESTASQYGLDLMDGYGGGM
jgi:hypothetical protein